MKAPDDKESKDLLKSISTCRQVMDTLQKLNSALFYLGYTPYHISKKLLGLKYLSTSNQDQSTSSLNVLGYLTLVNAAISAFVILRKNNTDNACADEDTTVQSKPNSGALSGKTSSKKCPLCLELRKDASSTPCGHIFCWTCIHDAVRTSGECPLCKHNFHPSRIVLLMNYL